MYKECKNIRSRQRSHHITQCLLDMMDQSHFSQITVSALCKTAGIPRKAFYRYFDSKDDVFDFLVDHIMAECVSYCSLGLHSSMDVTPERLTLCYQFWLEHSSFLDKISRSGLQAAMLMRAFHLNSALPDANFSGGYASDLQMQTLFSVTGIFSMIMQWHASGFDRTPEQMAHLTMNLLSPPISPSGKVSQM